MVLLTGFCYPESLGEPKETCGVSLSAPTSSIIATKPLDWDGAIEHLPIGWDDAFERAVCDFDVGRAPTTLCAIQATVGRLLRTRA